MTDHLSFIYVVDYGDYYSGSCAHFPQVFTEVKPALEYALEQLERMKRVSFSSAYAVVREYFRPDVPSHQPWEFVQVCMVHKDEEWIANEVDEVHGSSPV